jgi:hypothetical protein
MGWLRACRGWFRTRWLNGLRADRLGVVRGYARVWGRRIGTHAWFIWTYARRIWARARVVGTRSRLIWSRGWCRHRLTGPCTRLAGSSARLWPRYSRCRTGFTAHAGVHDGGRDVDVMGRKRSRCYRDRRPAVVYVDVLLPVLHGLGTMLHLGGQGAHVLFAHGVELALRRPHVQAAPSTVVADAVVLGVPWNVPVVDVTDTVGIDVVDGPVVHEAVMVPVAAVVAGAGVSVAVGNATVEANVGTPVALVEAIAVAKKSPPAGRPECAGVGGKHPDTGYPVVAAIAAPAPVAGIPYVIGAWAGWLFIDRKLRRRLVGLQALLIALLIAIVVGVLLIRLVIVRVLGIVDAGVAGLVVLLLVLARLRGWRCGVLRILLRRILLRRRRRAVLGRVALRGLRGGGGSWLGLAPCAAGAIAHQHLTIWAGALRLGSVDIGGVAALRS